MSDLKLLIQKEIQKGMNQLGTIRKSCTFFSYPSIEDSDYNPETSEYTRGTPTQFTGIQCLFSAAVFRNIDPATYKENSTELDKIQSVLIANLDLPFEPKIEDEILIVAENKRFSIFQISFDPAMATWSLLVSRIS